jgi:hypothetical protein
VGVAVYALYRPHGSFAAGAVAIAAGAHELTPLKRHFRRRCRESVRSGFEFGLHCVCSSIGLIVMLVALGVMSVSWMSVVAVLVLGQKLLAPRASFDVPLAPAIIGLGVLIVVESSTTRTRPTRAGSTRSGACTNGSTGHHGGETRRAPTTLASTGSVDTTSTTNERECSVPRAGAPRDVERPIVHQDREAKARHSRCSRTSAAQGAHARRWHYGGKGGLEGSVRGPWCSLLQGKPFAV